VHQSSVRHLRPAFATKRRTVKDLTFDGVGDDRRLSAEAEPSSNGMPEFMGRSNSSITLYGLLFADYPLPAGRVSKIVWRMTGSGQMRFSATGPRGQRIAPAWSTLHYGSNWDRPGEEWGTGFRFPVGGCWTVRATRGTSAATATLLVE
jgi:hypothetical protein